MKRTLSTLALLALTALQGCSNEASEDTKPTSLNDVNSTAKVQEEAQKKQVANAPAADKSVPLESYVEMSSGKQAMFAYLAVDSMPLNYEKVAGQLSQDYRSQSDEFKKRDMLAAMKPAIDAEVEDKSACTEQTVASGEFAVQNADGQARLAQMRIALHDVAKAGFPHPCLFESVFHAILEIGDPRALHAAISDAFPGARLNIDVLAGGRFGIQLFQEGLLRPLSAAELSDGTLRYLLLIAALLTPRPPTMMVLNEPETSLHPDLLPALARLIVRASQHTQVWVVSHARRLIAALQQDPECNCIVLEKNLGQTEVVGQRLLDQPAWYWPDK